MDRRTFLASGVAVPAAVRSTLIENSTLMPSRVLGRTGLAVSLLGFGCADVRDAATYRCAVDLGITYFHLGDRVPEFNLEACKALRPYRDRIVVSHMTLEKSSRSAMIDNLDRFLKASGFEYVDIWYLVTPTVEQLGEFSEAVLAARKAGKTRAGAISTHNLESLVELLIRPDSPVGAVMSVYNFTASLEDRERIKKLHAAGLGIVPMKPLAGRFYEDGAGSPEAELRWLAADPMVHSIPVTMRNPEQVQQNVAALGQPFNPKDRDALQKKMAYTSARFCHMCGACAGGCPQGLAVSDLVRVAMYAEGYRDMARARRELAAIPEGRRRVECRHCGSCDIACPNGVDIPGRLGRVQELFA